MRGREKVLGLVGFLFVLVFILGKWLSECIIFFCFISEVEITVCELAKEMGGRVGSSVA